MDKHEFERLRDMHGKYIEADIRFEVEEGMPYALTFKDVVIWDKDGYYARLNGTYKPLTKSVIFNVAVQGTGAICRVCVNGTIHSPHGRTHKHALITEDCPRQNLRQGVECRPDLVEKTAREVFRDFCVRAHIQHKGQFFDPEVT